MKNIDEKVARFSLILKTEFNIAYDAEKIINTIIKALKICDLRFLNYVPARSEDERDSKAQSESGTNPLSGEGCW
jgi:hypothetical protein